MPNSSVCNWLLMLSAFFIVVLVVVDLIGFGKYARFSLEICEARNQFCND